MRRVPRPPRVRRLEVAERMPLYVIRLTCGHATFERIQPCVAFAVMCGQVVDCSWCSGGKDV